MTNVIGLAGPTGAGKSSAAAVCKKLSIKVDKLRWFAYANLCMEIPKDRENRHGRDTLYQRRD